LRAALVIRIFEVFRDEAHVPAQQPCPRSSSRLPRAYRHCRWPQRAARPSRSRPQEAFGLIQPVESAAESQAPDGVKARGPAVLTRRSDFVAANRGLRVSRPGFVLLAHPNQGAGLRFGITVTKRIGNAVVRNRMKRRFRALLRELLPAHGLPDTDHVLIGREGGVERDFAALRDELFAALGRAQAGKGDAPRPPRGKRKPKR
jgi:ribonuclease P protein component